MMMMTVMIDHDDDNDDWWSWWWHLKWYIDAARDFPISQKLLGLANIYQDHLPGTDADAADDYDDVKKPLWCPS